MSIAFSFTPPSSSINKFVPSFSISPSSIRFGFTPSLPPSFRIHRHKDLSFVLHSTHEGVFRRWRRRVEDYCSKKNESPKSPNKEVEARKGPKKRNDTPTRTTPHEITNSDVLLPEDTPPQMQNKKERRQAEAARIREKYPDRIPVIVERAEKSDVPDIDKKKYLVPADLTFGQFVYVVGKRIKLSPEKAIFRFLQFIKRRWGNQGKF